MVSNHICWTVLETPIWSHTVNGKVTRRVPKQHIIYNPNMAMFKNGWVRNTSSFHSNISKVIWLWFIGRYTAIWAVHQRIWPYTKQTLYLIWPLNRLVKYWESHNLPSAAAVGTQPSLGEQGPHPRQGFQKSQDKWQSNPLDAPTNDQCLEQGC